MKVRLSHANLALAAFSLLVTLISVGVVMMMSQHLLIWDWRQEHGKLGDGKFSVWTWLSRQRRIG